MVLSEEDRIWIKNLYYFKGYGAKRLSEFSTKGRKKTTVNDLLKRLKETGSTTRKSDSGRPRTVRSKQSMTLFSIRKTHLRHIVQHGKLREMSIHHSSVVQIIRDELRLKCAKKRHAPD